MRAIHWLCVMCAVVAFSGAMSFSDDAENQAEVKVKPDQDEKVTLPWKKVESLTKDQKKQIDEIHEKALADIRAIRDREEADILAVLTEEQRLEVQRLQEERNAKRREREQAKAEAKKEKQKEKGSDEGASDTTGPTETAPQ